jgi:hypothetical protein
MGLKVVSFGLSPIPHCLVDQTSCTDEQMGILLCAGAMMNERIFGFTWGHHTDFEMAKELGDLEEFKAKARALVKEHESKAKLIVETISGQRDIPMVTQERFCEVLPADHPQHDEILESISKWSPSKAMVKAIGLMAQWQMAFPQAAANLHRIVARAKGIFKPKENKHV